MSTISSRNSLAASFIRNNFSVFGFGSPDQALLQSVKELVDNALDACRQAGPFQSSNGARHEIQITLKSSNNSDNSSPIVLEVTDTGCGIRNPSSFLEYFNTDKLHPDASEKLQQAAETEAEVEAEVEATTTALSGRFGVGLSVCLLYSVLSTEHRHALRLVSRTRVVERAAHGIQDDNSGGGDCYLVATFSVDRKTGRPCMLKQVQLSPDSPSATTLPANGTSVEIYIRRPSPETLPLVLQAVDNWLARLRIISASADVRVKYSSNLSLCSRPPSSASTTNIASSSASTATNTTIEESRGTSEAVFMLQQAPYPLDAISYATAVAQAHAQEHQPTVNVYAASCFETKKSLTVRVTAVLKCDTLIPIHMQTTTTPVPAAPEKTVGTTSHLLVPLSLNVWRYVNCTPLLDRSLSLLPNTAGTHGAEHGGGCALVAGVDAIRWSLFGLTTQRMAEQILLVPPSNRCAPVSIPQAPSPLCPQPSSLLLMIDFHSEADSVQWTGLDKRCVAEPPHTDTDGRATPSLAKLVAYACEKAIQTLHIQLQSSPHPLLRQLLQGRQERSQELIRARNVPALAEALCRLVTRLPLDQRERSMRELGIEDVAEMEGGREEGSEERREGGYIPKTNLLTGELEAAGAEVSSELVEARMRLLLLRGIGES